MHGLACPGVPKDFPSPRFQFPLLSPVELCPHPSCVKCRGVAVHEHALLCYVQVVVRGDWSVFSSFKRCRERSKERAKEKTLVVILPAVALLMFSPLSNDRPRFLGNCLLGQ